jgi:hypothetical protein
VTAAREAQPKNRVLEAVAANVFKYLDEVSPVPWYEPPHPVRTCFIGSEKGLVDRVELRDYVTELMSSDGPRTLIVRGAAGTGKSYSLDFIRFVEAKSREFNVAHLPLSDPDVTPVEFIRKVAYRLGLAEEVKILADQEQREQAVRWNDDLVAWLFSELRDIEKPWWLIVDGIDQVKLRADTYDLITKLVLEAESSEPLRVVLLACSEPLPPRVRVRIEEIKAITDDVLRGFFRDFLNHQGKEATDGAVAQAVREVHRIVGVDPSDPLWLTKLSEKVAVVARQL